MISTSTYGLFLTIALALAGAFVTEYAAVLIIAAGCSAVSLMLSTLISVLGERQTARVRQARREF